VWDAETGLPLTEPIGLTEEQKKEHNEKAEKEKAGINIYSVNAVAYVSSLDGRTSVVFSMDNTVTAQFSPDGQRIVTASTDGTARVWDAQSGQALTDPMKHGSGVTSAQFSPDGE
jgi:WD40 repeat protein